MLKSDRFIGVLAAALLLAVTVPAHASSKKYNLGRKATAAEIAGWNIDVRPDGQGLPAGQGSVDQGQEVYDNNCAVCHGTFGESNEYIPLTGVATKLNDATTLYDYINRAMPFPHSKSLTHDQVYAVAAYVLNLNNIVDSDFVANKETLPKVKMPAHDKMKPYAPMMHVNGKGDVHNPACMKDCVKSVKVTNELPPKFVQSMYGDLRDNFRGLATMNNQTPAADELPGGGAQAASKADPAPQLIQKYGCVACHGIDHKIVGPGFREVADKYKGNDKAVDHLTHKIRAGGAGVWGSIPMPPQSGPSDKEVADIVHWVLAGAPEK